MKINRATTGLVVAAVVCSGAALAAPAAAAPAFPPLATSDLVARDFTLYFANSGVALPAEVATGDHLGLYQGVTDQPYGPDATTGASWGYVVDGTSNPVRGNASTAAAKTATLLVDSEPAGASLPTREVKYDFDLPAGTYDVSVGFALPSGWGARDVAVGAEGGALATVSTGSAPVEETYAVAVTDGTLNLSVHSLAGRTDASADPAVNYVVVKAQPVWTPALLAEQIAQSALPAGGPYVASTTTALASALAAGQVLVDAQSGDPAAIQAAYRGISTAFRALRVIPDYDAFRPGQPWLDDNALPIQAHGGQVVTSTDDAGREIYYWYGEDRSNGYYSSPGVHVYSSYDLYNWADRGLALRAMSAPTQFTTDPYFGALYGSYTDDQRAAVYRDLGTVRTDPAVNPAILERPKVIYNESTHEWVMWVHADGPSATSNAQYAKANAGVAVSDSPFGPFRYIDSYRLDVAPAGEPNHQPGSPGMARDMNLFVDDDGTAYIIYSSEENYSLFVSKLNSEYTALSAAPADAVKGVDFTRPYIGAHREAPAMFKYDGTYYLITSGATGWAPNPAAYATATSILGAWTDHGNPFTGPSASTSGDSQSTSVLPIDPAAGKFIYMGDRWQGGNDLANAPAIWLPIAFGEGGSMSVGTPTQWTLADLKAGASYTVAAAMPEHVWLGDTSSLPTTVDVTTGGQTAPMGVTWDTSTLAQPGTASVTGTLPGLDGATFTRQVLVVPHGLQYVVNAGGAATADWTATMAAATTEGTVLNSSPEQVFGPDAVTGASWGYSSAGSGTYGGATDSMYTTLRYAAGGRNLDYAFDGLAPGEYTVYAGYYDPWPQANRAARVSVNGAVVDPTRLFTSSKTSGTYAGVQVGADGKLSVSLAPTRSPDIQLSWVMVADPTKRDTTAPAVAATTTPAAPGAAGWFSEPVSVSLSATDASGVASISYRIDDGDWLTYGDPFTVGAGTHTVTFRATDRVGNVSADSSVRVLVETPVLDDFDRPNGAIGGSWSGATHPVFYRIAGSGLDVRLGGPLVYSSVFGAAQEAAVTLVAVDAASRAQGILLKVQSGSSRAGGAISVGYDAKAHAVRVSTLRIGAASLRQYAAVPVQLADGDVLAARAIATGQVEVYKNGTLIDAVTLNAADQRFFNAKGGRIGLWSVAAPAAAMDDFRGGTLG